ncbi:tyrosine-protein phosphatase corkscrew-like isoform X3 [Helicoverpa zea]|uniref:tyrosine-protein phosphatase corkscrew-like isoform X3 n=1 Tax=Helicoverpa zea TaxID=7113 RepID=UPI001F568488|nr:tyrosine-protein phosphatase corkscrew-like isoform X3 [Helicoverpa zea]
MSRESRRLGVLAPAALSACMDASVLAVPAAGAIVSTVLNELSKAFMLKKWFHGVMSAKEAEHLIMEKGKNGSFLVRESQAHPGEFVLTVRVRGHVTHVMIRKHHDKYEVGSGEQFDDLVGLIEHCRAFPLTDSSGDALRLLQPVSGVRARRRPRQDPVHLQETDDCQQLDASIGFDGEFQSLKMLDDRHVFTNFEGIKPENSNKNRYRNVIPYDQTRVVLRRPHSDYINASYVRAAALAHSADSLRSAHSLILNSESKKVPPLVTKSLSDEALREVKRTFRLDKLNGNLCHQVTVKDKAYIAAQGCLSHTKDDFWRMLWQEDVRVIAMITNEVENGKAWPDHGTPGEPAGVLALIEDINTRMARNAQDVDAPQQNILCVHCSAGVGRTGTFIVLDILIDKIKTSGLSCDLDVHSTVQLVRAQRHGMVQNKAQYRFIYLALHEFIQRGNITLTRKVNSSQT